MKVDELFKIFFIIMLQRFSEESISYNPNDIITMAYIT